MDEFMPVPYARPRRGLVCNPPRLCIVFLPYALSKRKREPSMAPFCWLRCGLLSRVILYRCLNLNRRLLDTRLLDLDNAFDLGGAFRSESHLVHRMTCVGLRRGFPLEQPVAYETPHLVQLRCATRDDNLTSRDTAIA